jgi:hypothetical protein
VEAHGHEPPHRPNGTGFLWLDITLALSAFCVSLTTLWLAIHNARTMERLVAANSYPNIDVEPGNRFDFGDGQGMRPAVFLSLANTGIGPARLRALQLSFAGHPAANLRALLEICCTAEPAQALPGDPRYSHSGDLRGAMVPAGKSVPLFAWPETAADPRWPRLNAVRARIGVQVCYCSVFDECYVRDNDSDSREPHRVAACAAPAVPYRGD